VGAVPVTAAIFVLAALLGGAAPDGPLPVSAETTEWVCPDPGTAIFPDLDGVALQDSLRRDFRPPVGLSYSSARNIMYSTFDNDEGVITGVYTGFAVQVDPATADPKTVAFNGGINTEHTWPKSKGADHLPAEADMHHLYPTEIEANAKRGNHPFAEIPDEETDLWYRLRTVVATPVALLIDEYSEFDATYPGTSYDGRWEPPETQKGNVARAMFYFYTVYRAEANAEDTGFFDAQKDDLRAWHLADPADDREYLRTCAIAPHQADRVNPFVVDPTLVDRAYFDGVPVRLVAFRTEAAPDGVRLVWETQFETDHAGFHVIRVQDGRETRLTPVLITDGPRYAFVDRTGHPGSLYDYWLEAVARDGTRERFGPRSALFPRPSLTVTAHPNPVRAGETMRFEITADAPPKADLFDLAGRRVRSWSGVADLARGWDGRLDSGARAAPGVYFLRVRSGAAVRSVRLVRVN